jgi:hypothetical protein
MLRLYDLDALQNTARRSCGLVYAGCLDESATIPPRHEPRDESAGFRPVGRGWRPDTALMTACSRRDGESTGYRPQHRPVRCRERLKLKTGCPHG